MNHLRLYLLLALSWGLPCLLTSQETDLDPSIFDGTGTRTEEEAPEPDSPGVPEGGEDATEVEPLEAEASASGTAPSEPESPAPRVTPPEEPQDVPKGNEEAPPEEMPEEEEVAGPGSPAPAASQQSRAGEQVTTTDRIAPGQAVDLPWDL